MGGENSTWLTPFKKQCFVVTGVCLNMSVHGIVVGFASILLPQLKEPGSTIPIDDSSGSWIASILGFALIAGNFIVPTIMARYGRRTANLISIVTMLVGWFCILLASSINTLLVARFVQGLSMGMATSLAPVLIGEYSSPKNRGAFLTIISLTISTGILAVHIMGSYLTWQTTALVSIFIVFIDLLVVIYSPESPSFLADQGRYEKSKKIFRWLRGDCEEEELNRMIESAIIVREAKKEVDIGKSCSRKTQTMFIYFFSTLRKKEFYMPIFIMIHIYTLSQFSGANVLATYTTDIFKNVIGTDVNIALIIIITDIQRIVSNFCAIFVIKKVKRRTMFLITVSLNLFSYFCTAAYTYFKNQDLLPFDHPFIGVALIQIQMFSIATGTVPLTFIIAGELFPLEYRSLAGGISVLFVSVNFFLVVKTFPLLVNTLGLHGTYIINACIVAYCLIVSLIFLPETKDRTLQDIEDEFRGRPLSPEKLKSVESLTSLKLHNLDRRCSSPAVMY